MSRKMKKKMTKRTVKSNMGMKNISLKEMMMTTAMKSLFNSEGSFLKNSLTPYMRYSNFIAKSCRKTNRSASLLHYPQLGI